MSSPSVLPTRGRIPSPLHAFLAWLTAAFALVVASLSMAAAAAASVAARGGDPVKVLGDPQRSPLVAEPLWIALGTLANELATLTTVGIWWLWLRPPRRAVLPLSTPSAGGLLGALLVVFGLAPLAEVAGELVHRVVQNDITASKVVIAAARGSTPGQFALILVCLALLPAIGMFWLTPLLRLSSGWAVYCADSAAQSRPAAARVCWIRIWERWSIGVRKRDCSAGGETGPGWRRPEFAPRL